MAVTSYPDVLGGLFGYLRACTDITALTSDRIGDEVKDAWAFAEKKAKYAIVIPGRRGGSEDLDPPLERCRFDVFCYGPNKLSAATLMNIVLGYLCPRDGQRNGFIGTHVAVTEIALEGGPNDLIEPDTRWAYSVATIRATFDGVPF